MIGESSNKKILGGLLTLGTLVGITISGGFVIRGYLDSREADLAAREAEVSAKEEKIEKSSQVSWGAATGGLIIAQED